VTTILGKHFDIKPETEEDAARWAQLAERGSRIHALIAQPPQTKADMDALPESDQYGLIAAQRFVQDYGFRTEDSELQLASVPLGYAGTVDRVGRIPKGRVILDWKTGQLRPQYVRLQLGAYYGIYTATYPRRFIYGAMGVQLNVTNGSYAVAAWSVLELIQAFLEFIDIKGEVERE
jgi:ATP-dependent exoDNAse (exonuclease V) beta subunit